MIASLPSEVSDMMAQRMHRMHHWIWHEVRNNWNSYPHDIQHKIEDLGWKPPRPVLNEARLPDLTNNSGEDFLFMHRQMIGDVNTVLAQVGDPNYPRVQGWMVPPPPDDPDYPVPSPWFDPDGQAVLPFSSIERIKSPIFYEKRFLFWQRTFTDPTFLRGINLGQLGVIIEFTIHNAMHMRWAASPAASRPDPGPTEAETIGTEWDDPRYNFLGDTYSSHVNPIFWKLHGWIDDRIEDWKIVNGVFGNDFWKGTWVGKMPGHEPEPGMGVHAMLDHSHDHGDEHADGMERVVALIAQSGVLSRPFVAPFSVETW